MFSGIIEDLGKINDIEKKDGGVLLSIESEKISNNSNLGDSICVNGVCLTVTSIKDSEFSVDIVKESLEKSNLGELEKNSRVNLERSLQYNKRIGGHLVQGHIDTIGKITEIIRTDEWTEIFIEIDDSYKKYCIYKGCISIDGVSLTIAELILNRIKIALIPHTLDNTILSDYKVGQSVNIETDMQGKYIENYSRIKN